MDIDHVAIRVGSTEASLPYYDALLPLLGFHCEREGVWSNGRGLFLQFLAAEPGTRPYERYGAGMNHLGFSAPDPAAVEQVRAAMAAAGFPAPEIQHMDGAVALFMADPDGIRFEITHYPPGTAVVS